MASLPDPSAFRFPSTIEAIADIANLKLWFWWKEQEMNGSKWCERERNYVSKEWDCEGCQVCKDKSDFKEREAVKGVSKRV